jgi:hypothetical protein
MHQQSLDYEKHCSIPFGTYVQADTKPDPKNTRHPHTLDCLYLRYVDNNQGGHHLLDLRTGRTIKQHAITAIPITQNVIDLVHAMATNLVVFSGFRFWSPVTEKKRNSGIDRKFRSFPDNPNSGFPEFRRFSVRRTI